MTINVRELGVNKSIQIIYNHEEEIKRYWIPEMPLKVIVHGWLDSISHEDGVFSIKTGKFLLSFTNSLYFE